MYNNDQHSKLKTYVLDTNVLLGDPKSIFAFDEHDVIIPLVVIEELDNVKTRQDEVGKNARDVSRALDELRSKGSLFEGIRLPNQGLLKVEKTVEKSAVHPDLNNAKADNLLIQFMLQFVNNGCRGDAILVSRDINVRLKCDALGIKCEDYKNIRVAQKQDDIYTGVSVHLVNPQLIESFFDSDIDDIQSVLSESHGEHPCPNEIVVLKSSQQHNKKSAIARYVDNKLIRVESYTGVYGLTPKNKEQNFSFDLLLDPRVKLVTLTGPAGTGKTLIALAAGLEQLESLGSQSTYKKVIVTRPIQPVGKDIGFLPGTLEEKMEPWIAPIKDNLDFLMGAKKKRQSKKTSSEPYLELMQQRGLIEIEAISYIRGRSIPNSFIVIDEAQNLSVHELKTIITRVGDGTKIVLTGDIEQIDNVHVDTYTNGLTYAIQRFKEYGIAGHVSLLKGVRSELATLASRIL